MDVTSTKCQVDQLLKRCNGQQIKIPYLFSLFPAWQVRFNSHCDPSIADALERFQRKWIDNPVALKRNRGIDAIYFSRSVFPEAAQYDLQTVVIWMSWLYLWDDALDFGELDHKHGEMNRYQYETLRIIESTLLGDESSVKADPTSFAPTCRTAQAWHEIGIRIRQGVESESSRKFMYDCLRDYVTASIELQQRCDQAEILDVESYLGIRMNTSGVYPTISMFLLTSHIDPPTWFFSHALVKEALLHINKIISIYNDVVSARHEIKAGHVDNIIPLLMYHKNLNAQVAVNEAVEMMKISYKEFLSTKTKLTTLGTEHDISEEVRCFIEGCINLCMGAIQWTYHIKRYFDYTPGSGAVDVVVVLGGSETSVVNMHTASQGYLERLRISFQALLTKVQAIV